MILQQWVSGVDTYEAEIAADSIILELFAKKSAECLNIRNSFFTISSFDNPLWGWNEADILKLIKNVMQYDIFAHMGYDLFCSFNIRVNLFVYLKSVNSFIKSSKTYLYKLFIYH